MHTHSRAPLVSITNRARETVKAHPDGNISFTITFSNRNSNSIQIHDLFDLGVFTQRPLLVLPLPTCSRHYHSCTDMEKKQNTATNKTHGHKQTRNIRETHILKRSTRRMFKFRRFLILYIKCVCTTIYYIVVTESCEECDW